MKKIIGELQVSNNAIIDDKIVIKSSFGNVPDQNGNLQLPITGLLGNKGDIILFNDENYNTQPIVQYAKITNTLNELEKQKEISNSETIYDLFDNKTWTYNNTTWESTNGINGLTIGVLYSNTDTLKLYYVNGLDDIKLVGGQTIGNSFGEIPTMNYFNSLLTGNGYQVLPSGMIIQWMNVNIQNSGLITFPTPFKSMMLGGFITNTQKQSNSSCIIGKIDYSRFSLTDILVSLNTISTVSSNMNVSTSGTSDVSILVWGF